MVDAIVVDVITVAKRDLKSGGTLDGIGGFHTYGDTENHDVCKSENLLPMSLSEGCKLVSDIPRKIRRCLMVMLSCLTDV